MMGRPSGRDGPEPRPGPAHLGTAEGRTERGGRGEDAGQTRRGHLGVEAGILHGRARDRLFTPRDQIPTPAVDDRAPGPGRPGKRRHLPSHRGDRNGSRHPADRPGPGARGHHHASSRVAATLARYPGHPLAPGLDRHRRILLHRDAEPAAVLSQSGYQPLGLHRTLVRGPERPVGRSEPRPPALYLVGIQPVGEVSLLPLPGDLRPQPSRFRLVAPRPRRCPRARARYRCPWSPEAPRQAGRSAHAPPGPAPAADPPARLPAAGASIPAAAFHPWPVLALGLEHQHPPSGQCQLPGAGGAYRPTTHHDNIVGSSHLYFL